MILATTDTIAGKELETLGLVKGSTIQTVHVGKDIGAAFKTLVGGELKGYNDMMNTARALATKRRWRRPRPGAPMPLWAFATALLPSPPAPQRSWPTAPL